MRLVQNRLDRLNFPGNFVDNEERNYRMSGTMTDDNVSLSGEEKLELLSKLRELEFKKEKMNAMIRKVHNAQTLDLEAPNSDTLSNRLQNSSSSVGNDPEIPEASSPTLSLLDNLRALEVSHDLPNQMQNRIKNTKERTQNTNFLQEGDHMKELSHNIEPQISPIHNAKKFSSNKGSDFSTRITELVNSPRFNTENRNFVANRYNMEHASTILDSNVSKANNLIITNNTKSTIGQNVFQDKPRNPRQLRNDGRSNQINSQSSILNSASAIQTQIKDLENQIDSLCNEVTLASAAGSSSLAQESQNVYQAVNTQSLHPRLGPDIQTSSNSSFVMVNNSMELENDIGIRSLEHNRRLGNRRSDLNISRTTNSIILEKVIIDAMKKQQMKIDEQQKQISELYKSLNKYFTRQSQIENDLDGIHSVLRSLIDVVDNRAQQSNSYQHQSANAFRGPMNSITERQGRNLSSRNDIDAQLARRQKQPVAAVRSSISSDSGTKNNVLKLENVVQKPNVPTGPFIVNSNKNVRQINVNENRTEIEDVNSIDSRPTTQRVPSNVCRPIPTNHPNQSTKLYEQEINQAITTPPVNFSNHVKNDGGILNAEQIYDNEPWRNFEIDMNNGLGNISFSPLMNYPTNVAQERNLLNIEHDQRSHDDFDLGNLFTSDNNRDENDHNVSNHMLEALESFHGVTEPPYWARGNDTSRAGTRNTASLKDGAKAMLPAAKLTEVVPSSFANTSYIVSNITTSRSALNNQVAPGRRANNYWDNFKSYSRQNRLEVTPSTSQTHIMHSRPTAAVGAVAISEDPRTSVTVSRGSPMVAQVPPRQQSTNNDCQCSNNVVQPIPSQDTSFRPVEPERNSRNPTSPNNMDTEFNSSLRNSIIPQTSQNNSINSNSEFDNHGGSSSIQNNQNSAFVVPYLSNACSPSRPRRKQKINREQNRDVSSSVSNLEADNNIIQAAAMARAVANNSAAINESQSSALLSSSIDTVNHYPNVQNSSTINDLSFYPVDSTIFPFIPNGFTSSAPNPNIAATVHPIAPRMNIRSTNQNNASEARNNLRPVDIEPTRNQTFPDVSDVSQITRSIYGHINDLISQTDADPEQLQKLLESIQSARVTETTSSLAFQATGTQRINRNLDDHEPTPDLKEENVQLPDSISDGLEGPMQSLSASSNDNLDSENRSTLCTARRESSTNNQTASRRGLSNDPNEEDRAVRSNSIEEDNNNQTREKVGTPLMANICPQTASLLVPEGKH